MPTTTAVSIAAAEDFKCTCTQVLWPGILGRLQAFQSGCTEVGVAIFVSQMVALLGLQTRQLSGFWDLALPCALSQRRGKQHFGHRWTAHCWAGDLLHLSVHCCVFTMVWQLSRP